MKPQFEAKWIQTSRRQKAQQILSFLMIAGIKIIET